MFKLEGRDILIENVSWRAFEDDASWRTFEDDAAADASWRAFEDDDWLSDSFLKIKKLIKDKDLKAENYSSSDQSDFVALNRQNSALEAFKDSSGHYATD